MTMRSLTLDFIRPAAPIWPGLLLLALGGTLAVTAYLEYQTASDRAEAVALQLGKLQGRASQPAPGSTLSRQPPKDLEADLQQAQQVADFLLLPWNELFAALEAAARGDVALLAIEPDARKNQVRISAEAKDAESLFAYLQRLEKVPQLQGVHLQRHEIREEDKQHPLRFTVAASWKARQ
jgi:Tfp pilus assembly protein PilN